LISGLSSVVWIKRGLDGGTGKSTFKRREGFIPNSKLRRRDQTKVEKELWQALWAGRFAVDERFPLTPASPSGRGRREAHYNTNAQAYRTASLWMSIC